jgi:hypothetical protein
MMKAKRLTHITTLRFRRWCRKGYAAFCSLGRKVSIGCLHVDLCNQSLNKQTQLCFGNLFEFHNESLDEALSDLLPDGLSAFLLQPVSTVTMPEASASVMDLCVHIGYVL